MLVIYKKKLLWEGFKNVEIFILMNPSLIILPAATLKDAIHFKRASKSSVWFSALSILMSVSQDCDSIHGRTLPSMPLI